MMAQAFLQVRHDGASVFAQLAATLGSDGDNYKLQHTANSFVLATLDKNYSKHWKFVKSGKVYRRIFPWTIRLLQYDKHLPRSKRLVVWQKFFRPLMGKFDRFK